MVDPIDWAALRRLVHCWDSVAKSFCLNGFRLKLVTFGCATSSSCAGAELPGPMTPDGPYRAVILMTAMAFVTTIFVHSVNVTDAR